LEALDLGNEDGVMSQEMSPGRPTTRRYSEAEKERAVRMVRQLRKELGHDHGTIGRVAEQLGIGTESLRSWVKQAEIDDGVKPGVTSGEAARIKELEQENGELRRANAILRSASAFFAAELDRPQK
jgi:transposase